MTSSRRKAAAFAALSLAASGCAGPDVAVKRSFDFSKIRRVAVLDFSGPSAGAAADEMVQALLAAGADVVERQRLDAILKETKLGTTGLLDPETAKELGRVLGVDAVFAGTVNSAAPAQSYVIYPEGRRRRELSLGQGGSYVSQGPVPGMPGTEVLTAQATVSETARMIDVETGSILWSAHLTYEGIDLDGAMVEIARSFVDSLKPVWLDKLR